MAGLSEVSIPSQPPSSPLAATQLAGSESLATDARAPTSRPAQGKLGRRAAKGSAWTLGAFGVSNVLRLLSNLLLARLLAPEAFGVMAITTVILAWLNMLSDFGIKPSVIRSTRGEETGFLSTALTVQAIRGVGLAAVLLVCSWLLPMVVAAQWLNPGSVYGDPHLPGFLRILAIGAIAMGLTSPGLYVDERRLAMRRVVVVELASQLVTIGAIAAFAFGGLATYSLAVGTVIGQCAKTVGSYLVRRELSVGFGLKREYFREIFSYGQWLVVASVFGFLVNRGPQALLAFFIEGREFSLYAIGAIWVATGRTLVQQLIQKVGYPVFSEVARERPEDRTRIYYRVRALLDAGVCVAFVLAVVCAPTFFRLLYTPDYYGVARYVQLSAVSLILLPYNLLNTVILAQGHSRRFTLVTIVPGVAMVIGVPLCFELFGLGATVIFTSLAQLFALPVIWAYSRKFITLDPLRELRPVLLSVVAAALILTFVH